jgi:hypothetical protein
MLRFLRRFPAPPPAPAAAGSAPVVEAAGRVRRIPGVTVSWSYGQSPAFACARHCGRLHVVSGRDPLEALHLLEDELLAANREIRRDAFRLL